MAKDALFRNSLGGYNKSDVNRYIEELGIQYTERSNELESEIKELKKELEALPALRAEKERAEKLSAELEALEKENSDLSDAIKAQGEELEAKSTALSSVTAEKDALEIRMKELSDREEKLTAENARITAEFELKAKELASLSAETEAMKKQLEDDRTEFEKRAEEMLQQIQVQARSVVDKANETAEMIIANAKKRVEDGQFTSTASYMKKDGLSDLLDSHKSRMDSFFSSIAKTLRGDGKQ